MITPDPRDVELPLILWPNKLVWTEVASEVICTTVSIALFIAF